MGLFSITLPECVWKKAAKDNSFSDAEKVTQKIEPTGVFPFILQTFGPGPAIFTLPLGIQDGTKWSIKRIGLVAQLLCEEQEPIKEGLPREGTFVARIIRKLTFGTIAAAKEWFTGGTEGYSFRTIIITPESPTQPLRYEEQGIHREQLGESSQAEEVETFNYEESLLPLQVEIKLDILTGQGVTFSQLIKATLKLHSKFGGAGANKETRVGAAVISELIDLVNPIEVLAGEEVKIRFTVGSVLPVAMNYYLTAPIDPTKLYSRNNSATQFSLIYQLLEDRRASGQKVG